MRAETELDDVFRALAEPRRRAILHLVAKDELPAGDIAARFDVTRPAVSQHLQILKAAGLVTERRDGVRRLYRASSGGLRELRGYLDELWAGSLDTAKGLVEHERVLADDLSNARAAG